MTAVDAGERRALQDKVFEAGNEGSVSAFLSALSEIDHVTEDGRVYSWTELAVAFCRYSTAEPNFVFIFPEQYRIRWAVMRLVAKKFAGNLKDENFSSISEYLRVELGGDPFKEMTPPSRQPHQDQSSLNFEQAAADAV